MLKEFYAIEELSDPVMTNYLYLKLFEKTNTLSYFFVSDFWDVFSIV